MSNNRINEHVIVLLEDQDGMKAGTWYCKNCGESYLMNLPVPIDVGIAAMGAFGKLHKRCKKIEESGDE